MARTLIINGTIISPTGLSAGDVLVDGETIAAIFQPGQVRELRASIAVPHKRLFFAGEHTAVGSRGMEGALESGERASLEVMASLG